MIQLTTVGNFSGLNCIIHEMYELQTIEILQRVQSWTSPGSNTPQDTNCTATCPLSRKLFKLDEPDMQDTAGEAEMNS